MAGFSLGRHLQPPPATPSFQQNASHPCRTFAARASYGKSILPYTTAGTPAGESSKVQSFLRSPFDLAAFGPRLAVGALLSLPDVAQNLSLEADRLSMLLQDPRPPAEKQQLIAKEVEARVAGCLQRGAALEADVLTAMASLLPADVKQQLPAELKDVLLRGAATGQVATEAMVYQEVDYMPTTTVAVNQTAAEMDDLCGAVMSLREALTALAVNTDPAQEGVLKLNISDTQASLARRLQQLTPAVLVMQDAPVAAATEEARLLLSEVQALQL